MKFSSGVCRQDRPRTAKRRGRWFRPCLERLEDRLAPATVNWINANGGDWDTAGNWSTDSLPGPQDDVVINVAGNVAITHSQNVTDTVNSITAGDTISLSAGTLSVAGTFSDTAVNLTGGTLANASIAAGTTLQVTRASTTLSGVTLAGTLNLQGNYSTYGYITTVQNGLTLNGGQINLNAGTQLLFAGTQSLSGTGTVTFVNNNGTLGDSVPNDIDTDGHAGTTLTIAAGVTIQGGGGVVDGRAGSLVVQGTVAATGPGTITVNGTGWTASGNLEATSSGTLALTGTYTLAASAQVQGSGGGTLTLGGTSWTNQGSVIATNSTLTLNATSWQNAGTISATGSHENLGGAFTLADLGSFTYDAGTVSVVGTLDNSGTTLALNDATGTWNLAGGEIRGGTVTTAGSAVLQVYRTTATLDGVTLAGNLSLVGNYSTSVYVTTVLDGLTLAGGQISLNAGTHLLFAGTQSLSGTGTVTFVNDNGTLGASTPNNVETDGQASTTLTIAAGVTIQGAGGVVDGRAGSLIIQGTVAATGPGTITVNGTGWTASGNLEATSGGTLALAGTYTLGAGAQVQGSGGGALVLGGSSWTNYGSITAGSDLTLSGGSWHNDGTISSQSSMLNLGGTFRLADLGSLAYAAGSVHLIGTLNNTDTTLTVNDTTGTWNLVGGTIRGGTVTTAGSAVVQVYRTSATLDDVTLAGTLDLVGNGSTYGYIAAVQNGLTLNGGRINVTAGAHLFFNSTETLGGTGTVVFTDDNGTYGDSTPNSIGMTGGAGTTLTIGPDVTVQGVAGAIDAGSGNLDLQGTIQVTGPGSGIGINAANTAVEGSIHLRTDAILVLPNSIAFNQSGTLEAEPGSQNFNNYTLLVNGVVGSEPGATVLVRGDLLGSTTDADQFTPQANVVFEARGSSGPLLLEAMSADLGDVPAGFENNFAYGNLELANSVLFGNSPTYVQLVDNAQNSTATGPEAVYVNSLIVPSGATLDLNGLHLYARVAQINGTVVNGSVSLLPEGGPLTFSTPSAAAISAAGQVDDWSFFGRAGQAVRVDVGTGPSSTLPALAPTLNYAQVQVVDSSGDVMATAANTQSGADVLLPSVTLPADDTYHIRVQAAPAHASSTGDYVVALWDATVHTASMDLNQDIVGQLDSPYAQDDWTFSAAANQQIKFNLLNSAAPGSQFTLTGPGGWTGFSGLTTSSDLITLPSSGTYTLVVHGVAAAYDFRLDQTSQTALTAGTPYTGTLAGSGQALLFSVAVPQPQPLLISLQDPAPGDDLELYASYGAPPTRGGFQYQGTANGPGTEDVDVSVAAPGTWYILVYAENVATAPGSFTLNANLSPVVLAGVSPDHLGNAADAVLTLTGAGFDATTNVSLVAGDGTTYPASQVQLDLPTQLTATFAAGSVPAGSYSVAVTRGDGASASLANAFTMLQGGQAQLHTNLVVPSTLGYHIPATLYLQYSNTGTLAMPAPILDVTITQTHADGTTTAGAFLTLDSNLVTQGFWTSAIPDGFSHTIEVLASGATPGVLEPGESIRVPIYYAGWQQPWDTSYPEFHYQVSVEQTTDTTPIPWDSIQTGFQPPSVNTLAWNAMFPNLEAQVGDTWGDFVQRLDDDAEYLWHLGEQVKDIGRLWTFEVQQANGFSPLPTLQTNVDAQIPTPGPALKVTRAFPNSIIGRNQIGPFGWGWEWTDGWENVLTVSADGTVIITQPNGSQRRFQPDSRGGGYFAEAGDHGVLTAVSGFILQEADGNMTAYGANGAVAYMQDTKGNRVTAGYTNGLLTSLTGSAGQSLTFAYNDAGRIISVTDSAGRVTTYSYDPTNQYLLSITPPDGAEIEYSYDTSGAAVTLNALTSVNQVGVATDNYSYDAEGRLAQTNRNGDSYQVTYVYGPGGDVAARDADGGTTHYSPDDRGVLVKVEDALGNTVHLVYDANFNLVQVMGPSGQTIINSYNSAGDLIRSTDPSGATISFGYAGPFNRMTSYTDPNGNTMEYAYDGSGNLLSITYPDQTQQQFSYDPLGNLTETINRRGQAIHTTYNAMGQLTQEDFADGSHYDYSYDARGNMISASGPDGTITFQSDPATDHLLQVSYPDGHSLSFSYDAAGRRTRSVDEAGFTIKYLYNGMGLLAGLQDGSGNPIVTYTYDAGGRLTRKDMANGTFTTYQYDLAGNLLHLINFAPDGSVSWRFDYTYDDLGRRRTMMTLDGEWTYQYDPDGQLTHAIFTSNNAASVPNQDLQYLYDLAGNRVETIINGVTAQYVTNNLNQYTQVGSATFSYDADGNLVSKTDSTGTTTYTYDELNRLIGVQSANDTAAYQYDSLGHLIAASDNGQSTQLVVDPLGLGGLGSMVAQYGAGGGLLAHYVQGAGLVSRVDSGGTAAFYQFDGQGNTVQLTGSAGSVLNSYIYLPFGEQSIGVTAVPNSFTFAGEFGIMSSLPDLDLMRARAYSTQLGRFEQPDPLGLSGGTNFYRYVNNSPLDHIDASGTTSIVLPPPGTVGGDIIQFGGLGAAGGVIGGASLFGLGPAALGGAIVWGAYVIFMGGLGGASADFFPPGPPGGPGGGGSSGDGHGHDPNAAIGPAGFGTQNFVDPNTILPYRFDFENDPTATSPVQRAVVTDELDPNLDWSTFQLTELGFGDNVIAIPPGSQHFQTSVPMTYNGQTFQVQIEIGLHSATGQVYAIFQAIDPSTGLPPDAQTGFLPPEDGTGRGMGYFSYTIFAKTGLLTGTQIRNVADVTFDVNPPIATDQVDDNDPSKGVDPAKQDPNTIDSGPPTSGVGSLPAFSPATFTVNWSGLDDPGGSGLAFFDVYVSDNGRPYTVWQPATSQTSATFTGQDGHSYSFYSIATDNVGNTQSAAGGVQSTMVIGTAQQLVLNSLAPVLPGASFGLSVRAADANGLTDPLYSGTASLSLLSGPGRGKLSGPAMEPFVNGVATFSNLSLGAPGSYTLLAASDGALIAGTATVTVLKVPTLKVMLAPATAGNNQAGQPFTVTVTALLNGQTDSAYDGPLHITSSDMHAILPGDQTLVNGSGSFQVTLNTPGKQSVTVSDDTLSKLRSASNTISVAGTPPTGIDHFTVTGFPTLDVSGVTHTVTISAVTVYGLVVPNYTGTIQITSTADETAPVTVQFTAKNKGIAKTPLDLTALGVQALVATDGNKTGMEANIDVVSAATHLGVSAGPSATAGVQISITVTALTASGQTDALFADALQLVTSDPRTQITRQGISGGLETFNVTFFTAGNQTVKVLDLTRPGILGPIAHVTVLPSTVFQLLAVSGYPLFTVAGVSHSFTVTAEDRYGNRITNFADTVTVAGQSYTFQPRDMGAHLFTTALSTPGAATLTASDTSNLNVGAGSQSTIVVTATVALTSDPEDTTENALVIVMATAGGTVIITPTNTAGTAVAVTINGTAQTVPVSPLPLGHILVYGQSGKETVKEMPASLGAAQPTLVAIPAIIFGGNGSDILSAAGSQANNILVGGSGKNTLTAGTGNDLLIGGPGGAVLHAGLHTGLHTGSGNDLLIGGSTVYDSNLTALLALMSEWGRADGTSYLQRVTNLFDGGGLNGSYMLDNETVRRHTTVDRLFGGAGQDWFWLFGSTSPKDLLSGFAAGEVVTSP